MVLKDATVGSLHAVTVGLICALQFNLCGEFHAI